MDTPSSSPRVAATGSASASPGTPSWLGSVNDRAALAIVVEHGVATRNLVHRLTGLSKPTASQVMGRLAGNGLVVDIGLIPSRRGPSATGYAANTERHVGVAIEVTRRSVNATLVDVTGTEYPVHRFLRGEIETGDADGNGVALAEVRAAIRGAALAAERDPALVRHLLLSIPGSVNPESDELWGAEALLPWPVSGLRALLEGELGVTVRLERDVKLATVAELAALGEPEDICLLWLGSGLGLVNVANGQIVPGRHGRAGEIGYLPAPAEHGSARDMQDLLGGPAVRSLLEAEGIAPEATTLDDALAELASLVEAAEREAADDDAAEPAESAAEEPDAAAETLETPTAAPEGFSSDAVARVLEVIADRITLMAMPTLFLLDPERLVLAGPTAAAGGERLARMVNERVRPGTGWTLEVTSTRVEGRAPLVGARLLLLDLVRSALLAEAGADS